MDGCLAVATIGNQMLDGRDDGDAVRAGLQLRGTPSVHGGQKHEYFFVDYFPCAVLNCYLFSIVDQSQNSLPSTLLIQELVDPTIQLHFHTLATTSDLTMSRPEP